MTNVVRRKDYPLSMRLPETDVAMIDRAAALKGRSRTEFVRDAAVQAAEQVVMEQGLIRMNADAFDAFVMALSASGQPVAEMATLQQRQAPWETASESVSR